MVVVVAACALPHKKTAILFVDLLDVTGKERVDGPNTRYRHPTLDRRKESEVCESSSTITLALSEGRVMPKQESATKPPLRLVSSSQPEVDAATPPEDCGHEGKAMAAYKVWRALNANPGGTAVEIALAAGVSRSTARKALVVFDTDGAAKREPSDKPGVGDRWYAITIPAEPVEITQTHPATAETSPSANQATPQAVSTAPDQAPSTASSSPAVEQGRGMHAGAQHDPPANDTNLGKAGPAETVEAGDEPGTRRGNGPGRLAPGALRGMVDDFLLDHPGHEYTSGEIGRALRRSAGAVANALETLVNNKAAVRTQERPKRYTAAVHGDA